MNKILKVTLGLLLTFISLFILACDNGNENTEKPQNKEIQSLRVSSVGKTDYFVGDSFNPAGFILEAVYDEKEDVIVTLDMCDIKSFTTPGTITITITYDGLTATTDVLVKEKQTVDEVVKIEVKTEGTKVYEFDSEIDLSGYVFTVTYKSGTTTEVLGSDEKISASIKTFPMGDASYEQDVVISYDGKVETTITLSILDEWDYEDYLDDLEIMQLVNKLDEDLKKKISSVVTEDIELPTNNDYDFRLKLSWATSNPKVISVTGIINPREEDENVTLTLDVYKLGSSSLLKHYDFDLVVKGLGPVEFEDLSNKKIVMAYFYEGTFREMSSVDGNKIDIMCYCFGRVESGKLSITGLRNINTVMKWRRDYKMRVLLSIGGGASGGFTDAVKDDASRKKFVDSIMDVIKDYGFDGIDMDWEYPGWTGLEGSSPYDVQNFSYLLRDLRAAMDEYKEGLLLTAAVISSSADKFYQPKELNKYLDYVNIMTYDGDNSGLATHHTKPFGSGYSAENAINLWINAGVSPEKIIVGAAFYGKISELATPVSNPQDALGKATISRSTITYTSICSKYLNDPSFRECYDSASGAYFLSDGRYFITYDNLDSITSKAGLVNKYSLGGMMFWDYGSDSTGQLLSAVYSGMRALNK